MQAIQYDHIVADRNSVSDVPSKQLANTEPSNKLWLTSSPLTNSKVLRHEVTV